MSGEAFLDLTINKLGWTDTVFVFGYSNGREAYIVPDYLRLLVNPVPSNTLVFFGSDFLNTRMDSLVNDIADPRVRLGRINSTLIAE